jgi:hypothetical protein
MQQEDWEYISEQENLLIKADEIDDALISDRLTQTKRMAETMKAHWAGLLAVLQRREEPADRELEAVALRAYYKAQSFIDQLK